MTEIFPAVELEEDLAEEPLPLYTDVKWDFENNCPVYSLGEPVTVSGLEAVKTWAYNALQTVRGRYPIYTDQYGSDFEDIVGKAFTQELKEAECRRFTEEALLVSPYIQSVDVTDITFDKNGHLTISGTMQTIYGKGAFSVG